MPLINLMRARLFINKDDKFSMIVDRSITPVTRPQNYENEKDRVNLGFSVLLLQYVFSYGRLLATSNTDRLEMKNNAMAAITLLFRRD